MRVMIEYLAHCVSNRASDCLGGFFVCSPIVLIIVIISIYIIILTKFQPKSNPIEGTSRGVWREKNTHTHSDPIFETM